MIQTLNILMSLPNKNTNKSKHYNIMPMLKNDKCTITDTLVYRLRPGSSCRQASSTGLAHGHCIIRVVRAAGTRYALFRRTVVVSSWLTSNLGKKSK